MILLIAKEGSGQSEHRLDSMLELSRKITDTKIKASHLLNIANQIHGNNPRIAERYAGEALELSINDDDLEGKMLALNMLGKIKIVGSNYNEAFDLYFASLKISEEIDDRRIQIRNLIDIGNAYYESKEYEASLKHWNKAKEMLKYEQDSVELGRIYNNLGLIFRSEGKYDSAFLFFDKSYQIFKQLNNNKGTSTVLINQGSNFSQKGDHIKSKKYLDLALLELEKIDDKRLYTYSKVSIARSYLRAGFVEKALDFLDEAEIEAKKVNSIYVLLLLNEIRSNAYEQKGQYKAALAAHKRFKFISDSINQFKLKTELAELELIYENEKIDKENRLLKLENERKETELLAEKSIANRRLIIMILSLIIVIMVTLFSFYILQRRNELISANDKLHILYRELEEKNQSIQKLNKGLEKTIEIRTKEITEKNERLMHYAYSNSHKVRGPLARIIGLINLIKNEKELEEINFYIEKMEQVSLELDEIIIDINNNISDNFQLSE